jgi:hypothetical protein
MELWEANSTLKNRFVLSILRVLRVRNIVHKTIYLLVDANSVRHIISYSIKHEHQIDNHYLYVFLP